MLVSVLLAPYTWIIDQSVLLPALLHGAYLARSRSVLAALALASASMEIATVRGLVPMHSSFFLWTSPFWLAWYLYAIATARRTPDSGHVQFGSVAAADSEQPAPAAFVG
jgi:hypothetical protein